MEGGGGGWYWRSSNDNHLIAELATVVVMQHEALSLYIKPLNEEMRSGQQQHGKYNLIIVFCDVK